MHDEFESDHSDSQAGLEYIKPEDRENLERVVNVLKEDNFIVFITGSCLDRKDYKDIDLVVQNADPRRENLYGSIEKLKQKFNISDVEAKAEKTRVDEWRENGGGIGGMSTSQLGPYVNSVILKRYTFTFENSKFDVSHSDKPFGLAKYVKKIML